MFTLKQKIVFFLLAILCFFLFSCTEKDDGNTTATKEDQTLNSETVYATSQAESTTVVQGVTLQTKEDTYRTDTETIAMVFKNSSDKEYIFPENFRLQILRDNRWQEVAFDENTVFAKVSNRLPPNTEVEKLYYIAEKTGDLMAGKYRIVVTISDAEHTNKEYSLTAEFQLV